MLVFTITGTGVQKSASYKVPLHDVKINVCTLSVEMIMDPVLICVHFWEIQSWTGNLLSVLL